MDRRLVVDWIDATVSALGLKTEKASPKNTMNDDEEQVLLLYSVARISDAAAQTISLFAVQVEEFKAILPKDEVWNLWLLVMLHTQWAINRGKKSILAGHCCTVCTMNIFGCKSDHLNNSKNCKVLFISPKFLLYNN